MFMAWPPQFDEGCPGAAENTNTASDVHRKIAGVTLNPVFVHGTSLNMGQ